MIRSLNKLQPWALCLLRITLGISIVYHGWDRIVPRTGLSRSHLLAGMQEFNRYVVTLGLPFWLGYVSTVTEFLGGIFLTLGLFTRFWGLMIAANMLVAIWKVNIHGGYGGAQFSLALFSIALMLFVAGSGSLSIDRRFGLSWQTLPTDLWPLIPKPCRQEVKAPDIQGALRIGGDVSCG